MVWKSRAISLLPLWAVRSVQSLSACTRVHYLFCFIYIYIHTRRYTGRHVEFHSKNKFEKLLHLVVTSWSCSLAVSKPVRHIPLLCVQWKTPDDGQRNCPKYVEFHSKNKFEKLMHLVGFSVRNFTRRRVTWTSNSWQLLSGGCTQHPTSIQEISTQGCPDCIWSHQKISTF